MMWDNLAFNTLVPWANEGSRTIKLKFSLEKEKYRI